MCVGIGLLPKGVNRPSSRVGCGDLEGGPGQEGKGLTFFLGLLSLGPDSKELRRQERPPGRWGDGLCWVRCVCDPARRGEWGHGWGSVGSECSLV